MANLPENTTDPILRPVTRLETTTKVFGGEYIPDDEEQRGISNLQAIELAERDQYIISRVGQAKVDPSGDIPGEPGIAPLDTSGKLPKSNNTSGVVFTSDVQTITNKTISYADNTMPGVVGETDTQTITNKTISYADNTMPGVVGETATQTLTNKTIDAKDNVMLCTATSYTASATITPTKQMMVTADASGITLTLGSGPYAGYALPILAVTDCYVSYTGLDGAATETLDVGSYITFIWDATGSYWVVDAGAFEKPTYISTTQTLTAVKKMIAVVDTQGVVLTLDAGPYDGFELPVLATADCQIIYTGVNGSVTKNVQANTYNKFVWGGTYWLPCESTAITDADRPSVGIPTLWLGTKPDWALDFGNGASTKYLWSNYPKLNNSQFKDILDHFKTTGGSGLCSDYDAEGFYVPDLRGSAVKITGTNGKGYTHDSIANVGGTITERLPNIRGEDAIGFSNNYIGIINDIGRRSGAFEQVTPITNAAYGRCTTDTYTGNLYLGVKFAASAYDATYKDDAHVTPFSVGGMWIVRYE